jgi:hypothetical protein
MVLVMSAPAPAPARPLLRLLLLLLLLFMPLCCDVAPAVEGMTCLIIEIDYTVL